MVLDRICGPTRVLLMRVSQDVESGLQSEVNLGLVKSGTYLDFCDGGGIVHVSYFELYCHLSLCIRWPT